MLNTYALEGSFTFYFTKTLWNFTVLMLRVSTKEDHLKCFQSDGGRILHEKKKNEQTARAHSKTSEPLRDHRLLTVL